MRYVIGIYLLMSAIVAVGLTWNGDLVLTLRGCFWSTSQAIVGAPATPVSYAGVARRTTVRVATPGVGTPMNRGGPVNRVGRR